MKKRYSFLTFSTLILFWELYVYVTNTKSYVLPSPSNILKTFFLDFENIFKHSITTFSEAILGLLLALIIALILGVLMDFSKTVKFCVLPLLTVSQTVPIIVLTPLLVLYLGFGMLPKIVVIILMCFFPICINFTNSLEKSQSTYESLIRNFGGNTFQVYKIAKIPASLPEIFSGLKISATYSVTGAVVGEWIGAKSGLGYYLIRLNNSFLISNVFAVVLAIILLSFFMLAIVNILESLFLNR